MYRLIGLAIDPFTDKVVRYSAQCAKITTSLPKYVGFNKKTLESVSEVTTIDANKLRPSTEKTPKWQLTEEQKERIARFKKRLHELDKQTKGAEATNHTIKSKYMEKKKYDNELLRRCQKAYIKKELDKAQSKG